MTNNILTRSWRWEELGMRYKRWKSGASLTRKVKQVAVNVMIKYMELNPEISMQEVDERCADLMGISKESLKDLRKELKKSVHSVTPVSNQLEKSRSQLDFKMFNGSRRQALLPEKPGENQFPIIQSGENLSLEPISEAMVAMDEERYWETWYHLANKHATPGETQDGPSRASTEEFHHYRSSEAMHSNEVSAERLNMQQTGRKGITSSAITKSGFFISEDGNDPENSGSFLNLYSVCNEPSSAKDRTQSHDLTGQDKDAYSDSDCDDNLHSESDLSGYAPDSATETDCSQPPVKKKRKPTKRKKAAFKNLSCRAASSNMPSTFSATPLHLVSSNVIEGNPPSQHHLSDLADRGQQGAAKRAKKNQSDSTQWLRNRNRIRRMKGQEYCGLKRNENGKWVQTVPRPARTMKPACSSARCAKVKSLHCNEFGDEERQAQFAAFSSMNWDQRKVFISSLTDKVEIRKRRKETLVSDAVKHSSYKYHLKRNDKRLQVCRTMFLNTLGIAKTTVQEWLNEGERGMHHPRAEKVYALKKNKNQLRKRQTAHDFLSKLPKLPSQYCRSQTDKQYIDSDFESKTNVYRLYKEHCKTVLNEPFACRAVFLDELQKLNIDVCRPKKDQNDRSLSFKAGSRTNKELPTPASYSQLIKGTPSNHMT